MSDNIRIRTTVGSKDKSVNLKIDQNFDFIEILSLKISQEDAYRRFCSDYGVAVGRVTVNNGLGVPNAKVSVFIPIDEEDAIDPEILGLYPYEVVGDKDEDGIPYNLLARSNRGKSDKCFTPVGTFPNKREVQDNPEMSEIFCKYYKFTTSTNQSGDFMFFGLPVGSHFMHVDADVSDIGYLSQKPYDLIREGVSKFKFESNTKFKNREQDTKPTQINTISPVTVTVLPFWGDTEECSIGITRTDIDLLTRIVPSAIFMGSIFSDNEKNSINKKCRPRKKLGRMDEVMTGEGRIEMLRKTSNGGIERFDVEGGELIDEHGTWAFQVPMNLDFITTSEDGTIIPSEDPTKGIPTRGEYRFKISMAETGGEGRLRTRANYLVPHNPSKIQDADYSFDGTTRNTSFAELFWNKIYTVKNHLPRLQPNKNVENRNFVGIKDVDSGGSSPFPFNRLDNDFNPLFAILCIIINIIAFLVIFFNTVIITLLNIVLSILNVVLRVICNILKIFSGLTCRILAAIPSWLIDDPVDKCDCIEDACLGCGQDCSCDCSCPIIPYIPYITLGCSDDDERVYAPGGLRRGAQLPTDCNGCGPNSSVYPFKLAWEATQANQKENIENQTEASDDTATCGCDPDNSNTLDFFYPDDGVQGHCYFETIPPGDAGWTSCITISLAESLNVFKFDFYNDWINGTLYSFLVKYKRKRNGKEKFCEVDCDGDSDNNCKKNYIVDSCTAGYPQNADSGLLNDGVNTKTTVQVEEGYIKKYEDELFYAAYSKFGVKMWATDIVSLGAMTDCDWQGDPKIYEGLVDTSFNKPPLTPERVDDSDVVETSGFDNNGPYGCTDDGANDSLIGAITCFAFLTGPVNCVNIRRLCEIGVGLDEIREDSNDNPIPVDNLISNQEVDNPFIRGTFAYVNGLTGTTTDGNPPIPGYPGSIGDLIPFVFFDKGNGESNVNFPDSNPWNYDTNYFNFRGVNDSKNVWQYENSFYFYFGLRRSALQKMKRKYFTPCRDEKEVDFYCISTNLVEDDSDPNNGTGELQIEMVGGLAPYTYQWTGPIITINGTPTQYPLGSPNTPTLTNLFGGTYTVKVTDSVGNISECSFLIPGPTGILCSIDTIQPVQQFGSSDGEVVINISDGLAPYTYDLKLAGVSVDNGSTSNNSITITGLAAGSYTFDVVDSGNVQTTCSQSFEVTEPGEFSISVESKNFTCFNGVDSQISISANGTGTAPFDFEITGPIGGSSTTYTNSNVNNVDAGTYNISATDAAGQVATTSSVTILKPDEIDINLIMTKQYLGCRGDNTGEFIFSVNGGTPDSNNSYSVEIETPNQTSNYDIDPVFTNGNAIQNTEYTISGLESSASIRVNVTDDNGCEKETQEITIEGPRTDFIAGTITVNQKLGVNVLYASPDANGNGGGYYITPSQNNCNPLKIKLQGFNGGWGNEYTNYNGSGVPTGGPLGRYRFELLYSDDNGSSYSTTNEFHIYDSNNLPNGSGTYPPYIWEIGKYFDSLNSGNKVWGGNVNIRRRYKVRVRSYLADNPTIYCEKYMGGTIFILKPGEIITTSYTGCRDVSYYNS